jgi:NitT/TauT family transport system substrate-binding protein
MHPTYQRKGEYRMRRSKLRTSLIAGSVVLALAAAACGGDDDDDSGAGATTTAAAGGATTSAAAGATTTAAPDVTIGPLTPVKFQMQWETQAQFAGYYAAVEKGFYAKYGLDVELLEGGVDIVPQTVLAQGGADFAVAWVPKALQSREQGAEITDIGQIFQRSGTLQVSFKDADITTPADLKGKKVGNWGFGNEYELFAGMTGADLNPASDVTLVQQDFNMQGLLSGDIDAAQAMIYNEYAQVLEAENPATGELYKPDELNVIDWNKVGTAMLQDAIWADTKKLESDTEYQETAVALLKGSIEGWVYCRDNAEECRDIVVAEGSQLGNSHQLWQMNEINKLVWPSPAGIGVIVEADWQRTVDVALNTKNAEGSTVITKEPEGLAYTNEYVEIAIGELPELDTKGDGFTPIEVALEPGGA